MILSADVEGREKALTKILPMQRVTLSASSVK